MTKAYESAVRLLARREHGSEELCDKLVRKGFTPSESKEALDACQRLDLQSDLRFVESYCRSRIRQGYGPIKISQELKTRRVDEALIRSVLEEERNNWVDYALTIWQKKYKGQKSISFSERQKQQRFLLYRGFEMDVIALVMKEG